MKYLIFRLLTLIFLLLIVVCIPQSSIAQTAQEKNADQLYKDFAYSKAAEIYEKLYSKDSTNAKYIQRLAYSYNKMLNYPKAIRFFSLLVYTKIQQPSDYYEFSQLLLTASKIDESKKWLEIYVTLSPGDQRAKQQLENLKLLLKLSINPGNITIHNMSGNTKFIDMCPAFYRDRIVYSSSKERSSKQSSSSTKNIYEWNNQPYLDLYISKPGLQPNLSNDEAFSSKLNSRYHEGPVCFTSDFNVVYFTRNSYFKGRVDRTSEGINNLKIFIAIANGNDWEKIHEFKYNSNKYSVGHPALSPDNKTLYFVSDMPGGFGQTDLYKCELVNGDWSKPINLGASINTLGKEMFPSIDKDGILYFSSNGRPGIGGLDIFAAQKQENGKYLIVNMGAPLNSSYDDFGLVINTETLTGYFSSNRPDGKGDDDNYSFEVSKIDLRVVNFDALTKKLIPGSTISLLSGDGKKLDSKTADKDGAAEFTIQPGKNYQLVAENKKYLTEKKSIKTKNNILNFKQLEDVYLKNVTPSLTVKVLGKVTGELITAAILNISEGGNSAQKYKDGKGVFNMTLKDSVTYSILASAENYFDNGLNYSSIDKVSLDNEIVILLEKITVGKQFVLEDLYYDLGKYNIRPDAAIVLDRLYTILKNNPGINIEIGSHTDSRSSTSFNQNLSQKRSESVVAYLASKGIQVERILAKGYGESQLVNRCADGVYCTEAEHQANRRTVVKIQSVASDNLATRDDHPNVKPDQVFVEKSIKEPVPIGKKVDEVVKVKTDKTEEKVNQKVAEKVETPIKIDAPVKVEKPVKVENKKTVSSDNYLFYLILFSSKDKENASKFADRLKAEGYDAVILEEADRIRIGIGYQSNTLVRKALADIKSKYPDAWILIK